MDKYKARDPAQLDNAAARQRVKNFLTAWLIHRDQLETLTYIAEEAYRRPPIVGSACDGWYRPSDSPPRVREIVGRNLINSANTHPKDTPSEKVLIIQALPARLKPFATNPFEEDLFFMGRLDDTSLMKDFNWNLDGQFLAGNKNPSTVAVITVFQDAAPRRENDRRAGHQPDRRQNLPRFAGMQQESCWVRSSNLS